MELTAGEVELIGRKVPQMLLRWPQAPAFPAGLLMK